MLTLLFRNVIVEFEEPRQTINASGLRYEGTLVQTRSDLETHHFQILGAPKQLGKACHHRKTQLRKTHLAHNLHLQGIRNIGQN